MHISMTLDGTTYQADANPKTYSGTSTRSAFKKQFGVPLDFMAVYGSLVVDGDDGERTIDPSQVPAATIAALPDWQEAQAFVAWMELKRRCDDVPDVPWDKTLELIEDIEIDVGTQDGKDDGQDDPT